MTVTSEEVRWPFTPDGVATTFPYNNLIFAASDLLVSIDGVVISLNEYVVTGIGNSGGGSVVFNEAPTGTAGVIESAIPNTQPIGFINADRFPADDSERGYDRAARQIQQLAGGLDRALVMDPLDPADDVGTLPLEADRPSQFFVWDDTGRNPALAQGAASVPVSAAMAPVVGAATLALARIAMVVAGYTDINAWSARQIFTPQTGGTSAAGAVTFDFNGGNYIEFDLTENITAITLDNLAAGGTFKIRFKQDDTTAYTVTGWPAAITWPDDTAPDMNPTLDGFTLVTIEAGNTEHMGSAGNYG